MEEEEEEEEEEERVVNLQFNSLSGTNVSIVLNFLSGIEEGKG